MNYAPFCLRPPNLGKGGAGHRDDLLLPLGQDDDVINGPLVVALARVEGLPPAEACARCLGGLGQFIVNEAVEEIGSGGSLSEPVAPMTKWLQTHCLSYPIM